MSAVVAATPIIAERFSRVNSEVESVCNYPDLSHAPNPPLRAPEPATFCYIGALSHHRGLFEMLRAAEMADARLVLAGPFDSSALEAEARAMPQWSRVDYLGVVPHAEVWNAMSRAIAGLLLLHPVRNYIDSLPIKMYEYMAAGLPIIASDYAGWPDVVREERVGLNCDPVSAEALASAMRMLIEAPSLAQEMGERGPEVVRARYRWENEAAKLLALYGRLLPASG